MSRRTKSSVFWLGEDGIIRAKLDPALAGFLP